MTPENKEAAGIKSQKLPDKGSFKMIARFVAAYPVRSILMVAGMLFAGIAEGMSLVTMLPLLEFQGRANVEAQSGAVKLVSDTFTQLGLEMSFGALLFVIVIGIMLKAVFLFAAMVQAGYTVSHVMYDLRHQLSQSLLKARWGYFVKKPTGFFVNSMSSEVERAGTVYHHAIEAVASAIQVAVYWFVALYISWQTSVAAVVLAVILFFLLKGLIRISRSAGAQTTNSIKTLVARLTEFLQGIKPIKAMAMENRFQDLMDKEIQGLNDAQRRYVLASQGLKNIQEPLLVSIIMAGLYLAVTFGGQAMSGLLVLAFVFYRLVGRMFMIQACYQYISMNESALNSLQNNISDTDEARESDGGIRLPPSLEQGIFLRSVSFAYEEVAVLKDISMTIPAGKLVAIHGPSGAGKTTIIDLIVGLYYYQRGKILIDGVALEDIDLKAWRRMVGYVPQEMLLFHETVYNNITMGDDDITADCVERSLQAAGAWEFVTKLPQGLHTEIGERGSKLSGGQRQRISIARALARSPKLLILDEITTSLDAKTEGEICQTLYALRGTVTMIAISHQKAILEVADMVYRLRDGYVQEEMKNC